MDQEKYVNVNQAGGQLKIADDVIAIIAGLAISDQKGIEKTAKKGRNKGIAIRMEEGQVICDVELTIVQGTKIPKMAAEVQEKIKTAAPERPREKKLRFSYKEEREFASIDGEIAALEEQLARCQEEQNNCGSDYIKLQQLQEQQAQLEAELDEKMERWVYLTELKEKIDAQ